MIYHLHLTEGELVAIEESLTIRLSELWELQQDAIENPNELTKDLVTMYLKRQHDIRDILAEIRVLVKR